MQMPSQIPFHTERTPNITDLERSVLTALFASSEGNGHDFGMVEDCRGACAIQQLGGVIASLSKKGIIDVHEAVTTDSGRWTQTTWSKGWTPEGITALLDQGRLGPAVSAPADAPAQRAASASATASVQQAPAATEPKDDFLADFASSKRSTGAATIGARVPHGEEGHLNIYVRDHDSAVTGFGEHNRLVVMAEPDGSMVSAREDYKWGLPETTEEQRRKILNNETYRMHPKGARLEYAGSDEPFINGLGWASVMHNYRVVKAGVGLRDARPGHGRDPIAWKERNANHTASFGDVLLGQCHVRIKQVDGRFNAAYVAPDHSRFDAPTVLGTWNTLDEAKTESLKVLSAQPWCPGAVREALAPAPQGPPEAGPEKGTLWWNAESMAEAEAWRADLLAQGCDSVELKPEADSEHVRVLITLDRARANEILGYPVEEEEWLIFEDQAPVQSRPVIVAPDLPLGFVLGAPNQAKAYLDAVASQLALAAYRQGYAVTSLAFQGDEADLEACACTVSYREINSGKVHAAPLENFAEMEKAVRDNIRYAGTTMVNGTSWAEGRYHIHIHM